MIIWHSASGTVPVAPRSHGEIFLVFTYIWLEDDAKILKVPRAPRNVNPALAITSLEGVAISCTIF